MGRTLRLFVTAAGAFGIAAALAMAAPSNGNFETGDFSGWKTVDQEGNDIPRAISKGKWQVYKNKLKYDVDPMPPRGGIGDPEPMLSEPPQGTYAAGLASTGPGAHILHRKITVSNAQQLSLKLAYHNTADDFYVQNDLRPEGGDRRGDGPNQQLRVDIMKPGARINSLKAADIVENVFRTQEGDELERDYFKLTSDLEEGQYRLRIAEVDNQSEFLVGVDAVKLKSD